MSLLKLSWKNLWRNKTRSGVILGAIALGLFAGTYLSAFMSGWMVGSVKDEINTNLAHIQIRDTAFTENNDINAYFLRSEIESRKLENAKISYRLNINGMIASANNAAGVQMNGVDKEKDKAVSCVWQTVPDSLGAFLPDDAKMPIVISAKTAKKLKVKLKSKVVFSFQDATGEIQSAAFRVCGIFRTANTAFDEGTVFVRYSDLQPVSALPENAAHVAALYYNDVSFDEVDEITPKIRALFPYLSVKNWKELNPTFALSLGYSDIMVVVILGIFLLALAFGIINTMLMAVLERTRELGMLRAIGMSRRKVFSMIMLETVLLTLVGSIIGIAAAVVIMIPSIKYGIDLTPLMGDNFEDYGFSSIIFPVVNIKMFMEIVILVIAAGILSAIYPARKALKLRPLEAIRE